MNITRRLLLAINQESSMKKVFDETFNYYRIPNIYWNEESEEEDYKMYTSYYDTNLWSDTNRNEYVLNSSGTPVFMSHFTRSEISASTTNIAKYSPVFFYESNGIFYDRQSARDYHRLITTEKLTEGVYIINFSFKHYNTPYPINYSDIFVITDTSQLYEEIVSQKNVNYQAFEEFYIYNNEIYVRLRYDNIIMEWDEDYGEYNYDIDYAAEDIRIVIYKL